MTQLGSADRTLVVGTFDRPDILQLFKECPGRTSLSFLEYEYTYGTSIRPATYRQWGALHRWHQFAHAQALLKRLRPNRIAFLFCTSLNQIALNQAAKQAGIPTFHVEHGFRLPFGHKLAAEAMAIAQTKRYPLAKLKREWPIALANHSFFWRSLAALPNGRELAAYAARNYRQGTSPESLRSLAHLRQVDHYLGFSPETHAFHAAQDKLEGSRSQLSLVGIPYFDHFAALKSSGAQGRRAILVDHQLHEAKLFGWTTEFRKAWAKAMLERLEQAGFSLSVKAHPGDRSGVWKPYEEADRVRQLTRAQMLTELPHTQLVLGTFSTMQLPLAGLPWTTSVTLEIHPEQASFPSEHLVKTGAAHAVTNWQQLEEFLADFENKRREQEASKPGFIAQHLHRFDGQSGTRLANALLGARLEFAKQTRTTPSPTSGWSREPGPIRPLEPRSGG